MIVVNVNTVVLQTKLKFIVFETDSVRKLMQEVCNKIGETFLNLKAYVLVPIYPKDLLMYQPVLSKFGGETDMQQDMMFNYA